MISPISPGSRSKTDIREFVAGFGGTLITDTMLIAGINDDAASLTDTADFPAEIALRTAYLAVPTRPTTVMKADGTDEPGLIRAHEIFAARLPSVELLTGHEVGEFAHTGDARKDLLAEVTLKSADHKGERFYLRPVRCSRD